MAPSVPNGTVLNNTATVNSSTSDPVAANNFASDSLTVVQGLVGIAECRTPPEQARLDMDVLTQMFLKA